MFHVEHSQKNNYKIFTTDAKKYYFKYIKNQKNGQIK